MTDSHWVPTIGGSRLRRQIGTFPLIAVQGFGQGQGLIEDLGGAAQMGGC